MATSCPAPTRPARAVVPRPASALGTPRRWAVFAVGLCCLIGGIALTVAAELGVGSWQVLETGLVETTGASYGLVAFLESLVAIGIAWRWLGQRPWLATGILAFGGVGIGALLAVLPAPSSVAAQVALLVVGVPLIAVGVAFYLAAELGASAQDALFVGIYRRYRARPGHVRLLTDGTVVVAGALLGGQLGIGTLVMTVAVPAAIEPALRVGHRLAGTPPPEGLDAGSAWSARLTRMRAWTRGAARAAAARRRPVDADR